MILILLEEMTEKCFIGAIPQGFSSTASIANSRVTVIKTRNCKIEKGQININKNIERLHAILATR